MAIDWGAVRLTVELAAATVACLLVIGTPIAWWLARTRSPLRPMIESLVALPMVLPPTVLGFYLLILFGKGSPVKLAFTFEGLVVASIAYSLPFVVQPLQQAFMQVGDGPREAAASLGAGPLDAFFTVISPLALRGYVSAIVLGFAHTVGEFGVVLMVGGNIPGETRVISIAIYEAVETLDWQHAHVLSAGLLAFSFAVLMAVYALNHRPLAAGAGGR